jgi:hypothetical protein
MRIFPLKSAPRQDLREKMVELLALRAKVAKFEKAAKIQRSICSTGKLKSRPRRATENENRSHRPW